MTEGGLSKLAAVRQFNTTTKTVAKWVERFRAEGADGLSAPFIARPNPPARCAQIETLRRQRMTAALPASADAASICGFVSVGSWSCKNALAIASMPRDVGGVAVRGHFRRLVDFSVWKRF